MSWLPPSGLTAGELDERVTIERKAVTRDAALGSEIVTWAPIPVVPTVWAKCTDVRDAARGGDEQARQDQRIVQARTTVLMRWRADVAVGDRILWPRRGRTLSIVSTAQVRRRTGLELSCEEWSV